jgi:hypothetical protein
MPPQQKHVNGYNNPTPAYPRALLLETLNKQFRTVKCVGCGIGSDRANCVEETNNQLCCVCSFKRKKRRYERRYKGRKVYPGHLHPCRDCEDVLRYSEWHAPECGHQCFNIYKYDLECCWCVHDCPSSEWCEMCQEAKKECYPRYADDDDKEDVTPTLEQENQSSFPTKSANT